MIERARYRYPRLGRTDAGAILEELKLGDVPWDTKHDRAAESPTGGIPVGERHLQMVRDQVLAATAKWGNGPIPRAEVARWDEEVGVTLHRHLEIIPTDAAAEGVWSFLTLVLLPDVAISRFPDLHSSRFLGVPRNVFRRTWWRRHVLQDLAARPHVRPLGEDELVNLFERSRMARNRRLVCALANEILDHKGSDRSHFARELTKLVRRRTGPVLFEVLDDAAIAALVAEAALEVANQTTPAPPTPPVRPRPPEPIRDSP